MSYQLVIGNKNGSSWSLRPWLAMKHAGLSFTEVAIDLRAADAKAQILARSPSGRVPALLVGDQAVWDSLAIIEFLAEEHPEIAIWPAQRKARAHARSVSAEMHSSFHPLRVQCPMDFVGRSPRSILPEKVAADVRRIVALWRNCRSEFGVAGPYLFGAFSAADAMYAPVASRFRTYLPDLAAYGDDGTAQAYVETLFKLPQMQEWEEGARAEVAGKT